MPKNTDRITLTPLEENHPLVMIFWTETTYDKETKKNIYTDKYIVRDFKLSSFLAEKTNSSLKKFEKSISEIYCDKCNVWESYLRAEELKIILENSYDTKGKFSGLISNVCGSSVSDDDNQNIICIDLRRQNVNGKESVYLLDGTFMKFGKSADRVFYAEQRRHTINGLKKYYSNSFKFIHPNKTKEVVEKIKEIT